MATRTGQSLTERLNSGLRRVPVWAVYALLTLPALWLFWLAASDGLGADPVKTLERGLGERALQGVVLILAITPLRRFAGVNLLRFRRALGVMVFAYVVLHLLAWVVLDMGLLWQQALADIVKRPYVTVGMAGLVLMLPLALTSNNWAVRRLGAARWQSLHRLTYLAAMAGAVHYIWLFRTRHWASEPMIYLAIITALLCLRLLPKAPRRPAARLATGV